MEAAAENFCPCLTAVDCPEARRNLPGGNIPQPNASIEWAAGNEVVGRAPVAPCDSFAVSLEDGNNARGTGGHVANRQRSVLRTAAQEVAVIVGKFHHVHRCWMLEIPLNVNFCYSKLISIAKPDQKCDGLRQMRNFLEWLSRRRLLSKHLHRLLGQLHPSEVLARKMTSHSESLASQEIHWSVFGSKSIINSLVRCVFLWSYSTTSGAHASSARLVTQYTVS